MLYPTTWCLLLLVVIALLAWQADQSLIRNLSVAAALILWVAGAPWFSDRFWQTLELTYPVTAAQSAPEVDAIILLGGGVHLPKPPRVYAELNAAADRVLQAALLFKAGKAEVILVSGGQVFPAAGLGSEADYQKQILMELGVPADGIIIETNSRNTADNASFTLPLAKEKGFQKMLLVTSGYHMPRSMMLFENVAAETATDTWLPDIIAFPTDIRVVDDTKPLLLSLLPDADGLALTQEAIREYLGLLFYRLKALWF